MLESNGQKGTTDPQKTQCGRKLDVRVFIFVLGCHLGFGNCGRLARGNISLPKYQIDLEIAKKSRFSKLAQNEVLWALVNIALSLLNQMIKRHSGTQIFPKRIHVVWSERALFILQISEIKFLGN